MKLTDSQIKYLRDEFASIHSVNPQRLPEFRKLFGGMTDLQIIQISEARIKFLSLLAGNERIRRGIN